jgi:hypothetical protein
MQFPDPHHADVSDIDDSHPADAHSTAGGMPGRGGVDAADGTDDGTDDDTGVAADDAVPERALPGAPTTGDPLVDAAMGELAAAESGTLTERIDAGERAHRVLQGRLSDLGGV